MFDHFKRIASEKDCRLTALLDSKKISELITTEGASFKENWYGQLMCTPQMFAYLIQLEMWLRIYEPELDL